ncbi:MAG: SPFH domain-containing protein [bacterium]|nr:SPFH domain-containing protein [bacterium]
MWKVVFKILLAVLLCLLFYEAGIKFGQNLATGNPVIAIVEALLVMVLLGFFWWAGAFRVGTLNGVPQYATIEWEFILSPKMPSWRNIAIGGEQGIWAKTYGPGWHLIPFVRFFGKITVRDMFLIPDNKRGLIKAKTGRPLPQSQIISQKFIECDNFANGEKFLKDGGEVGTQLPLVPPGRYPFNLSLFDIELIDLVKIYPEKVKIKEQDPDDHKKEKEVEVEWPQFAYVISNIGDPSTEGASVADRLEVVTEDGDALSHNNFQNLEVALKAGLQRGVQPDIIEPGAYALNTEAIEKRIVRATFIPQGWIGGLISNAGPRPKESDLDTDGVLKPGFKLGGNLKIGVLSETLGSGFHNIHPIVAKVEPVNTTPLGICFDKGPNNEYSFSPIEVIIKGGYRPKLEVEVGIRVKRENVPAFLVTNRSLKEFVRDTLVRQINEVTQREAVRWSPNDFIERREKLQQEMETALEEIVNKKHVELEYFNIKNIDTSSDANLQAYFNLATRKVNAKKEAVTLTEEKKTEERRTALASQQAKTKFQHIPVEAELQKEASGFSRDAMNTRGEALTGLNNSLGDAPWPVKIASVGMVNPYDAAKMLETFRLVEVNLGGGYAVGPGPTQAKEAQPIRIERAGGAPPTRPPKDKMDKTGKTKR